MARDRVPREFQYGLICFPEFENSKDGQKRKYSQSKSHISQDLVKRPGQGDYGSDHPLQHNSSSKGT